MNIHIVTQTFPPRIGGMQTLMFSIAKGLVKDSKNVFVYPDHKFKTNECFKVFNITAPKFLRPLIKSFLIKKKYKLNDIVICDTWKSVHAVPKEIKNIYCFAIGQEFLKNKNNKNLIKIQKAFDRSKYIISITKFTENLLVSKCSVNKEKLKVIFPTFSIKSVKKIMNKKISKTLSLISICRIEDRKGLIEAAEALINIYDKIKFDFTWHIVGDGPSKEILQKKIEKSVIYKKVKFYGFISEKKKAELLSHANLFLMPGYMAKMSIEGFGIVYSEAANYGVPSIGGIDGGAPEAVIHNKTGWCVNPKDSKDLEKKILEAINNNPLREKLGKNAKKYFEKKFSSKIAFSNFKNLLNC